MLVKRSGLMSNININLINKLGSSRSGNKNSVRNKRQELENKKSSGSFNYGKHASNTLTSVMSGRGGFGAGFSSEISSLGGPVVATIVAGLAIANKSADVYLTHSKAKTGQSLYYDNIKQRKDNIMSLGTNYIFGSIRNEFFVKNQVKRQNNSLEYYRELYNYNNFGEKNKTR